MICHLKVEQKTRTAKMSPITETVPNYDALPATTNLRPCQSLTIDGNLIYDITPPSQALYELQKTLQSRKFGFGSFVTTVLRLDGPRSDGANEQIPQARDRAIYEMKHSWILPWLMILKGQRKDTYRMGYFRFQRHVGLGGLCWELEYEAPGRLEVMLRYRYRPFTAVLGGSCTWEDGKGQLIAVESTFKDGNANRPLLETKVPLDQRTTDLLISAWATRIAYEAW
jgi:hypothetical protein